MSLSGPRLKVEGRSRTFRRTFPPLQGGVVDNLRDTLRRRVGPTFTVLLGPETPGDGIESGKDPVGDSTPTPLVDTQAATTGPPVSLHGLYAAHKVPIYLGPRSEVRAQCTVVGIVHVRAEGSAREEVREDST